MASKGGSIADDISAAYDINKINSGKTSATQFNTLDSQQKATISAGKSTARDTS